MRRIAEFDDACGSVARPDEARAERADRRDRVSRLVQRLGVGAATACSQSTNSIASASGASAAVPFALTQAQPVSPASAVVVPAAVTAEEDG